MTVMSRFRARSLRFLSKDTEGSMPVEGLLATVFLVWFYVASFQFFDAFRQKNANLKGAYAIADLLARSQPDQAVSPSDIEHLNKVFDYITYSRKPTWLRVTSVYWSTIDKRFEVAWSYATGDSPGLTTATLQKYAPSIPVLPVGGYTTIVETNMAYEPLFNVGITAKWYRTFVPTPPRWAPCQLFELVDGSNSGACSYDTPVDPGASTPDVPPDAGNGA